MYRKIALGAVVCLSAAASLYGDEIVFKNGDHLKGKILSATADELVFKSDVAGEIKVKRSDIETFSTDEPIEVHLKDGTVLNQPVTTAPSNQVAPQGETVTGPVAVSDITVINPPPVQWDGSILFGGIINRGNTSSEGVNLSINAVRETADDRITLGAGYAFDRSRNADTGVKSTTTDNWFGLGKYDYFLSEKLYAFGLMKVERDRIADLDLRLSPSVGVGYQWVDTDRTKFATEAGLGWVYEDYSTGDSNDFFAARLAYMLTHKINDKVSVFHDLEYIPSVEDLGDFLLNTDAGIRADLTKSFFTEFKFRWQHDSEPAPGAYKNDLRYILGVGWKF